MQFLFPLVGGYMDLEKELKTLRTIEDHRTTSAEKSLRATYRRVLKELREFLGVKYAELAENGELTYEILQRNGEYARFLEEVEQKLNGITPETSQEIQSLVEQMYELAYTGMVAAVESAADLEQLSQELDGLRMVSHEVIKKAVENPVAGLTLSDTLERNRREIIYDIKRSIGVGLANGDRMSTMAKRFKDVLQGDYEKSIRIARTEAHRIREAGHGEAARDIDKSLQDGVTGVRMVKTWRSMEDSRVRKTSKANHRKMDGVQVGVDEYFNLGRGIKTLEPGNSGDAANDINCRCYVSYDLVQK